VRPEDAVDGGAQSRQAEKVAKRLRVDLLVGIDGLKALRLRAAVLAGNFPRLVGFGAQIGEQRRRDQPPHDDIAVSGVLFAIRIRVLKGHRVLPMYIVSPQLRAAFRRWIASVGRPAAKPWCRVVYRPGQTQATRYFATCSSSSSIPSPGASG